MTKQQLAFMFNNVCSGFYIKKDILVSRDKRAGKKYFKIIDMRTEDFKEQEVRTIDELFELKINGNTVASLMENIDELNLGNEF